jgi:hypothetical protein
VAAAELDRRRRWGLTDNLADWQQAYWSSATRNCLTTATSKTDAVFPRRSMRLALTLTITLTRHRGGSLAEGH